MAEVEDLFDGQADLDQLLAKQMMQSTHSDVVEVAWAWRIMEVHVRRCLAAFRSEAGGCCPEYINISMRSGGSSLSLNKEEYAPPTFSTKLEGSPPLSVPIDRHWHFA